MRNAIATTLAVILVAAASQQHVVLSRAAIVLNLNPVLEITLEKIFDKGRCDSNRGKSCKSQTVIFAHVFRVKTLQSIPVYLNY